MSPQARKLAPTLREASGGKVYCSTRRASAFALVGRSLVVLNACCSSGCGQLACSSTHRQKADEAAVLDHLQSNGAIIIAVKHSE